MLKLFHYSDDVRFESTLPLEQSIQRLSGRTQKSNAMIALASGVSAPTLVGSVTKDAVVLHRVIPLIGNFFKPRFYGRFVTPNDRNVLEGRFTMKPTAKVLLVLILAALSVVEIMLIPVGIDGSLDTSTRLMPVAVLGLIVIAVLFTLYCKWLAREDVRWISNQIASALQ